MITRRLGFAIIALCAVGPAVSQAWPGDAPLQACVSAFEKTLVSPDDAARTFKVVHEKDEQYASAILQYYSIGYTFDLQAHDPKSGELVAQARCHRRQPGENLLAIAVAAGGAIAGDEARSKELAPQDRRDAQRQMRLEVCARASYKSSWNPMRAQFVVAVSENDVIGRRNQLPWHLSGDLRRFKALTLGKPVLMGRKTYESIGQALPGRTNLVLSRSAGFSPADCIVVPTLEAAREAAHAAAGVTCP